MPLVVPEYIEVRTAAGATAAYLSPEADGLKDAIMDRELNGRSTLTFSLPILPGSGADVPVLTVKGVMPTVDVHNPNDKWQHINDQYRIYAPDITGQMREFVIQNPDAIEKDRNGKKLWGKVTAHESWVLLGKKYATISNDPQTPDPPWAAVIILSGGSDLSGGLYPVGSAAHALYAILQGTGWSIGTVDVEGTHDLETEKISVLENINKIQEIWGGYLVWDSVNKTVSLRSETAWAPYTGYQVRYAKNLKGITRTDDYDIITKLYPFGENDLNIGSVNGGQIYIEDHSYTDEVLEGIWVNQDIADPQELKDEATKYLAKVCKPRHNYRVKQVDLRLLSGYQHEDFDLGHLVDVIDEELGANDKARIIRYRFNIFQPWKDSEIEVGDPIEKIESMLADSREMVKYLDGIKTSKGQITAYKLVNESIIAEKIAKAAVDATKLNTKTVILLGDAWTDNNPSPGAVSWNQHKLYYAGQEYVIQAGNTNLKYIYWDGSSNSYSASADTPTLSDGQFIIAVNNGGLHDTVWDKGYAREFIGSAFIADAAIKSAHIAEAQILDAHIAELSANKINVTDLTALSSEDGYTKMQGDGVRVYDEAGNLMGHLGTFEGLGTQIATFTRNSVAYKQDGAQVAANQPRYEYAALPAPVWQDTFDTDQLATEYTSGGGSPAMWTVDGGVLTGTGGSYGTLIKNDLLLQDCEIVVNSDQAHYGAIIARYQDNNNYYMMRFVDDSGAYPAQNLMIYRRVGGTFHAMASADLNWTRGTAKQFKFVCKGSTLEAWFGGQKILSVTDTTFTGGGVGLLNSITGGSTRFLDFTVYYVQQGVMVEEDTSNLVKTNAGADPLFNSSTGWTLTNATIANGVLTLQSPDGSAVATASCTLTNLVQNTKHSFLIRARYKDTTGTANTLVLDLQGAGYDTAEQELQISTSQLTTAFQNFKKDGFDSQSAPASVNLRIFTFSTRPIEVEFVQLEQKAFATTIMDGSRAAEVMTVPTAGVFNKGNWTVKLRFTPTSPSNNNWRWLWECVIDSNNKYYITSHLDGRLYAGVVSGGVETNTLSGNVLIPQVGQTYSIMFSGNGSQLLLAVNGSQTASVAYSEPVGNLPANMCLGYSGLYGAQQANGIISDFAVMSNAQTLDEHQAEYASGLPLTLDEHTTLLMSMDGHLQPTVRRFGLWSKNGQIVLQDPQIGQGLEVWDGSTRKVLIGRLDDGTIGQEIVGGKLYSSTVRSGGKTDTTYIALTPGGVLEAYYNDKQNLGMHAAQNFGNIIFYEDGIEAGQLYSASETDPALGGTRRRFIIWSKGAGSLRLYGPGIHLDSAVVLIGSQTTHEVNIFGKFKNHLLPYIDNYGYIGQPSLRWNTVRAVNIQSGDLCFEEKTCPICEQHFVAGEALVLLVKAIHEEHGTMTIPMHDRCKDTPKTLTVEVPETEERYRLKEDGSLETYRVSKFEEVEEEVHRVKDGYELDEITGLFKKKAFMVPVAKEGFSAKLTQRGVRFYNDMTGHEVELTSILEPVEVFSERPAEKEEAVEVATVRRRRPVKKTITVEIGKAGL